MTTRLPDCRGIGEAFAERAAATPGKPAFVFVREPDDGPDTILTYRDLERRVRLCARLLRGRLAPGERVMLALPTGPDFVVAYLGCLTAGVVAVPVPAPDGRREALERVTGIARDAGAALVLTDEPGLEAARAWTDEAGLDGLACLTLAHLDEGEEAELGPGPERGDLAVLQYTSGSTGDPKGVMLTHGNILANVEALRVAGGLGPSDRLGGWIPLHHDMGLFALLSNALLIGGTCVLMSPVAFLKRPVEWLRTIDRHGLTGTAAPNFAFDRCTRLVTDEQLAELDLSRLRYMWNGSEPIHAPTMDAFTERFAPCGFRPETMSPGYGLAEATVFVSLRTAAPRTRTVDGRDVVGCGTVAGLDARIVDPGTRRALPDGEIGEIWLSGASVGRGYWRRPEESAATFEAAVEGEGGRWLRTGDLGFLTDDEVFVTGRLREILIVHGRNLFPQDLEQAAREAHPALTGLVGAAFQVPAPDERVVLLHEVSSRAEPADLPGIARAVSRRLATTLGVPAGNVVLVRRGTVRRTTSGKIRRGEMRTRFLGGGMAVLHAELEPAVRRVLERPLVAAGES
ncbi:fatty acyl-AMP ligase [Actinomadura oligospora]|uniref:fatty acyl-AMP ligase n=1 Tax=Actinomadura oligospora TaxID=111804 RepID=UPI0004BAA7C5|nr:fatty acyl-AMP ligase [Actinomadura oligospora]